MKLMEVNQGAEVTSTRNVMTDDFNWIKNKEKCIKILINSESI